MMNSIMRAGPARMMGLSSGMDTEFIIQQTLRMHQFRIDQRIRQRTLIEWRQQIHNSIGDELKSLRNTFLSAGATNSLRMSSAYNTHVANLTTRPNSTTNTNAVSIRTSADSTVGNFTILSVNKLDTGASITSENRVSANNAGFASNQRLSSLDLVNGPMTFNASDVRVGDATGVDINRVGDKIGDITVTDSGSAKAWLGAAYDSLSNAEDEEGNVIGKKVTINGVDVTINENTSLQSMFNSVNNNAENASARVEFITDIYVDGQKIELNANDTISGMISKVNDDERLNVTMSYDRIADKFTIESNAIGFHSTISAVGLEKLGIDNANEQKGTDAEVWVQIGSNGDPIKLENNSGVNNRIEFGGVTITLNSVFNAAFDGTTAGITTEVRDNAIDVAITRDVTDTMERITSFINSYNSIISRLEGLLSERKTTRERSYQPLTDEEKANMTEKQIEQWEDIARKGIMRNDSALQQLVNQMRASFFEEVAAAGGMRPSDIGLSTGSYFDGTGGQIIIDTDKLRAALEENPDRVMSMFTSVSEDSPGLINRLDDLVNEYTRPRGTQYNTLESIERSLRSANEQIERMQEKMWREEEALYRKFAAMETAMSQLQSQGDWFTQMLGGMQ